MTIAEWLYMHAILHIVLRKAAENMIRNIKCEKVESNMSNKILVILTCFLLILPLIGSCSKGTASVRYQKIDAREAKSIIDNEDDIVILDVRTKQEYDQGHILNAVLIPDVNLKDEVEEIIPDKNIKILVYCRSGRRSAASAKLLIEMGYKNVYDFGGINDWPYDIVTD